MLGVQSKYKQKVLVLPFYRCQFNIMLIWQSIKLIHQLVVSIYTRKLYSMVEISLISIMSVVQGKYLLEFKIVIIF